MMKYNSLLDVEAGTYVKELVHSDEGRTVPSVSSVLGDKECTVIWLDVEEFTMNDQLTKSESLRIRGRSTASRPMVCKVISW